MDFKALVLVSLLAVTISCGVSTADNCVGFGRVEVNEELLNEITVSVDSTFIYDLFGHPPIFYHTGGAPIYLTTIRNDGTWGDIQINDGVLVITGRKVGSFEFIINGVDDCSGDNNSIGKQIKITISE